jgi:hypothetical protein
MSGTQPHDLPSGEDPGNLADYAAMPDDDPDDDVIDISDNSGPELTTGVADIDPGSSRGGRPLPDDEP